MDVSSLCRSCMKEVASWEKGNFDKRAVDMFCFCTNIMIIEDDNLPKQFCYDCFIKIESSYTFIKESQKVNVTLKNIVSRLDTSVIIETECQSKFNIPEYEPKSNISNFTIPDYELNSGIDNFDERTLFETVQENQDLTTKRDDNVYCMSQDKIDLIVNVPNEAQIANDQGLTDLLENVESGQQNTLAYISTDIVNANEASQTTCEETKERNTVVTQAKLNVEKVKENICPVCRKGFTFKAWLDRHIAKEHADIKYMCEHCPKIFARAGQLNEHAICHSEERSFQCSMCDARFKRRKQLTAHSRRHSDVRPHECSECGRRFKVKSVLKSHMKLHENLKPYLCSVCGWSFVQAGNLAVHMRRHTGEKPLRCGECPFRTNTAASLTRHRHRHRATPSHRCRHCAKAFYDASGLARHVRGHTGELPFKCPYCSRAFLDSWKRKAHLMAQHRLALADIPRMPRDPTTQPIAT